MAVIAAVLPVIVFADVFTNDSVITDPDPTQFSICYDHGCASVITVSLNEQQWLWVSNLFRTPAENPEQERKHIAWAIALLEKIVGKLTGTDNDKGGDLEGLGQPGQMDCIDESTNTTTYLRIFNQAGLLKWHEVEDRVTRGWFITGWPHTTAIIRDIESNQRYAVDSWFLDNGEQPFVVPLDVWKNGWSPFNLKPPYLPSPTLNFME